MLQGIVFLALLFFHSVTCKDCKDTVTRFCEKMENICLSPDTRRMMSNMCPKTCKYCKSEECTDAAPGLCGAHKQRGECQSPTLYTRHFCKRTCNFCSGKTDANGKTTCKDTMKDCGNIARMGLCGKLGNVKERCRKSCKLCG